MADVNMCNFCFGNTKYQCILCTLPICNKCAEPEMDEDTAGWAAGKTVAYCTQCFKEKREDKSRRPGVESVLESQDLQSDDDDEDDYEDDNKAEALFGKKGKKKPGRKTSWPAAMLDDLVDIVVNNEGYKRKLVFINVKNQKNSAVYESVLKELKERAIGRNEVVSYTVPQLRNKFKRCVFECKRACLTVRTATGIKRLSDSKGKWFDLLYPVVKCRDSCNPELASEPSAVPKEQKPSDAGKEAFVPTHSKKRKRADAATESTDQILTLVKDTIANDPTQKLLDFMKAEMERERKHEAELFRMILQGGNNTLQQVGAQYMPPIPYGSVPYQTMLPNPQQAAAPSFDYNFQGPSPSGL